MATQITYKNAQIASFTTGTKTLKTSGKYMEADVVVTASGGGGAAISIIDESDSHGGIIRHINAVSLESDTVTASVLLSGYTAHDAEGSAITGAYVAPAPASLGSKTILSNGTYSASSDSLDGYSQVTVSVPSMSLQSKSAAPTESQQVIEPDSGYALSKVTIGAISNTYVGTSVTRRSSSDLSASASTVTVPSGYYSSAASTSISAGSAIMPATTVTANPTITVSANGLITATAAASKSVTPNVNAGYISSGTAGTVTVSGTNTSQLTTQSATTITPTTSSQTAVASGRYTTGSVTVAAIPSQYIVPSGNITLSENGTGINIAAYSTATVNVPTSGGGMNVQAYIGQSYVAVSTYTNTNVTLTVAKAGTYTITWMGVRNTTSGTSGSSLYRTRGGTTSQVGTSQTSFNMGNYCQRVELTGQAFQQGDVLTLRARARNSSYTMYVANLVISQTA